MNVSLVTLGDPETLTGGYLYHRRMAESAPRHDATVSFVSFPDKPFPLAGLAGGSVVRNADRADVVVLDSIAACYAAPWLGRVPAHVPVVAMLHQPPGGIDHGGLRHWITARLDMAAYRQADLILVASESLKSTVTATGASTDEIVVVPPGRDVAPMESGVAGDLKQGRRIAVLCVANWVARKGIVDALDAVAGLPDDCVTLHLIGDERLHDRYGRIVADRIRRSDLSGRVVRHGPLSGREVASMYRSADVFLLPSLVEPYGTVYGEAMAEGLPVVGYRAGNLPYLARHGSEGLLADPGDVKDLSSLLRRMAEDESARSSLGIAARARAESFPTWDQTASLFFGAIRKCADRGR